MLVLSCDAIWNWSLEPMVGPLIYQAKRNPTLLIGAVVRLVAGSQQRFRKHPPIKPVVVRSGCLAVWLLACLGGGWVVGGLAG